MELMYLIDLIVQKINAHMNTFLHKMITAASIYLL